MKSQLRKRIFSLAVALAMTVLVCLPASAYAENYKDYIAVQKNADYVKNGKYYFSYTYQNVHATKDMVCYASLYDSAGKVVATWKKSSVPVESGKQTRLFSYDFSKVASGKYTFAVTFATEILFSDDTTIWTWKSSVNHNASKISFASAQQMMDSSGTLTNKFNIKCSSIKGKALSIQIFDADGKLRYKDTGKPRATNNEVGWFSWNGWPSDGGLKCGSGKYTVRVSYPGGNPIQKTYNLEF
ncbi:hypothetical protein [Caproiciproducens sp.]